MPADLIVHDILHRPNFFFAVRELDLDFIPFLWRSQAPLLFPMLHDSRDYYEMNSAALLWVHATRLIRASSSRLPDDYATLFFLFFFSFFLNLTSLKY
jgi:hypothetical protein